MNKLLSMLTIVVLLGCNEQSNTTLMVEGDWKFSSFVEGNEELNAQNKAMVKSIVELFEDGTVSFYQDSIRIQSPTAGKRMGTYVIEEGKINASLGGNSQFSLNAMNEGGNLVILFNEDGATETGKIIFERTGN